MNNFTTRALSGVAFIVILVGAVILGSITYFLVFSIILILAMLEFYNLSGFAKAQPQKWLGIFTGWLFFSFNFLYAVDFIKPEYFSVFIPLIILILINELYLYHKYPITSASYTILGIVYIAAPLSFLNYFVFKESPSMLESIIAGDSDDLLNQTVDLMSLLNPANTVVYTPYLLLGFMLLIWIYDTFAYLSGLLIGRHKLFERVSPKKTWEGVIGGMIVTMGLSVFMPLFFPDLLWYNWLILSFITCIAATYGDLIESLFKRTINVKDSGNLIPGHGGVLDRFDSLLIACPIAFVYLQSFFN